ncbi:MAG: bacteriochlorophyll 4-vinyl reductase [Pseudomonadota bacterium]
MSKDAPTLTQAQPLGRIGPNAILQMLPVLDQTCGRPRRDALVQRAGLNALPDGLGMIPEAQAARLHQQVRKDEPERGARICTASGIGTAEYIMAHRIPAAAQWLLKALPARLAAPLLAKAIKTHAWTFVGSGSFRVVTPWVFEITHNPLIERETSDVPLCHWHASVFETLYQTLVSPDCTCAEVTCAAMPGNSRCRFEITRQRRA